MATYNGEKHLKEQLDSIVNQTLLPYEIIICDDGSTDHTVQIVESFARDSSIPIRFTQNLKRLGYADNFLHAASLASGRYISFADQDDIWHPSKIQQSRDAFTDDRVRLVGHPMNLVTEDGMFVKTDSQGGKGYTLLQPGRCDPFGVFFGFTMMFDRQIIDIIPASKRGADTYNASHVLSHDRWIYFLATTFGCAVLLADPLADYRQHSAQTFGITHMTFWNRAEKKIRSGSERVAALASISRQRRALLELSSQSTNEQANRVAMSVWTDAILYWNSITEYCRRRNQIYTHASLAYRAQNWLMNISRGAYQAETKGGLGTRHALEDLVAGVLGRQAIAILSALQRLVRLWPRSHR